MRNLPNDFSEKIKKKIDRARKADNVAQDSWDEVIEVVQDTVKEMESRGMTKVENPHDKSYDNFGDNKIAMMLFMDIIGYSKIETDIEQIKTINTLNTIVLGALDRAGCHIDDVICLPTGDGMCLCFTDPSKPLSVAEEIQKDLLGGAGGEMKLRMGIHTGGVVRVNDLKGWANLAGDAINMTQRAMDYGDEWHILCTADACQLLKRIKGVKNSLNLLGDCEVKHGTILELYNYFCNKKNIGNPSRPQKAVINTVGKTKSSLRKSARVSGN